MNKELKEYLKDFYKDGEGVTAEDFHAFILENYKDDEGQIITLAFDEMGRLEFSKFMNLMIKDPFEDYQRNFAANGIAEVFDIAHASSAYILERALVDYPVEYYKAELDGDKWDE